MVTTAPIPTAGITQRVKIAIFLYANQHTFFSAKTFQDGGWWFIGWQAINRLSDLQRNNIIESRWIKTPDGAHIKEYKITERGIKACQLLINNPEDDSIQHKYFSAKDRSQLPI